MKKHGQVGVGSTEWTVQRAPRERVNVTRMSLEIIQAENAVLKDILKMAREAVHAWDGYLSHRPSNGGSHFSVLRDVHERLATLIAQYDGWTESEDIRTELVQKLLDIADDLQHEDHSSP